MESKTLQEYEELAEQGQRVIIHNGTVIGFEED